MNEHLVPVVGHTNAAKELMDAHHSLPNGECWVYTGLKCIEHEEIFNRSPAPIFNFRMSPGHYILNPHLPPLPTSKEMLLADDSALPDEGDPDFWLRKFKELQAKLGTAMTRTEYRKQKEEFDGLLQDWDGRETRLREIAGDPKAAFREEAGVVVAEIDKPGNWDPAPEALRKAEGHFVRQEYGAALAELRSVPKTRKILRVRHLARTIERMAWEHLTLARGFDAVYQQPDNAKAEYRIVIDHFPGTEAERAARLELK